MYFLCYNSCQEDMYMYIENEYLLSSYVIYKAENLINGKVYIGQTTLLLSERIRKHKKSLSNNDCPVFYLAIKKYGWHNFFWSVIDSAETVDELNQKEIDAISLYRSTDRNFGYNLTSGGESGKRTIETKNKLKQSSINYWNNLNQEQKNGRGESVSNIDKQTAEEIIKLLQDGKSQKEVSEQLNVSYNIVNRIYSGKTWQSLGYDKSTYKKDRAELKTKAIVTNAVHVKNPELIRNVKTLLAENKSNAEILKSISGCKQSHINDIKYFKKYLHILPELNILIYGYSPEIPQIELYEERYTQQDIEAMREYIKLGYKPSKIKKLGLDNSKLYYKVKRDFFS